MEAEKFTEKMAMVADPYFDREFFTNLIYCMDRQKSARDILTGFLEQALHTENPTDEFDRSLLQLLVAFQVSSEIQETYRWLPLAQAMYSMSLFRSEGLKPLLPKAWSAIEPQATTIQAFSEVIRKETRAVESPERAWAGFLFLLQNRTTRSQAISVLLSYAVLNSDALTLSLLAKSVEISMAFGWARNDLILKRAFDRFWSKPGALQIAAQGWRLSKVVSEEGTAAEGVVDGQGVEDLWNRISAQTPEAAVEILNRMIQKGVSYAQIHSLLTLLRGRCLFLMKTEQWPRVCSSLVYGEALQTAGVWAQELKAALVSISLCELVSVAQLVGGRLQPRPSGQQILESASPDTAKDRLILRLEDACERGERFESLEVLAAILTTGLSHSLSDRFLLMACKQDAWTFEQRTMPTAAALVRGMEFALRHQLRGPWVNDAAFGLIRFLGDQRDLALDVVQTTGTYGDRMKRSQYDVSGGARIVDRFVFNQMRNAQRVKIWPRNN